MIRLLVLGQAEPALLLLRRHRAGDALTLLPLLGLLAVLALLGLRELLLTLLQALGLALLVLRLTFFHACAASSGEEVGLLRRLLATLASQLDRGLHRLAVVARTVQILHREDIRDFAGLNALEDGLQVRTAQRFLLQQLGSQGVEVVPVLAQHVVGHLLGLVHQHAHLVVDLIGHALGRLVTALAAAADERVSVVLAVLHGAHNRAHAVLHHHRAGDVRCHLNIRRSAGGRVAEDQFFGCAAAHGEDQAGEQFGAVVHALVVLRGGHGMATGTATREDRHLVDAVDVLHRPSRQRVAALVVGGDLLLVLRDNLRAAARATHHAVGGLFQRVSGNHIAFHAGGQQGGLVQHVLQVRTGHARGTLGQRLQVHVLGQRLVLRVHVQDLFAAR